MDPRRLILVCLSPVLASALACGGGGQDTDDPALRIDVMVGNDDFLIDATEVRIFAYAKFMAATDEVPELPEVCAWKVGHEPEDWIRQLQDDLNEPVRGLDWCDAWAYCEWAGLSLPTEAQWEYACRAGTTTRYHSGDREGDLARVGWYRKNSGGRLHSVGELEPNDWGLYDMHGNVFEWCQDDWVGHYRGADHQPGDGLRIKPVGDGDRVIRGGGFDGDARDARSAFRLYGPPDSRYDDLGFRPAQGIALQP